MKLLLIAVLLIIRITLLQAQKSFSFAYLPDIHLNPDSAVMAGFERMTSQANRLHPDFVLSGGSTGYGTNPENDGFCLIKIKKDCEGPEFMKSIFILLLFIPEMIFAQSKDYVVDALVFPKRPEQVITVGGPSGFSKGMSIQVTDSQNANCRDVTTGVITDIEGNIAYGK